ncbi:enkurin-like [Astyanax mexicanus]|uniref:Enkurin-like n=1 Tax=Astyanax mexicanus TaxID=7994 RepID=A0A8T2M452_ASTMX|nr:enkurin-like [Astyanax mexicanus]
MSKTIYPLESTYNLISREEEKIYKPPRYISRFREQVKHEKQLNKASRKTMGPPKVHVPSPDKYLLKHSKEPRLPEKKPFSYGYEGHSKKPPVPARTDHPPMGVHTKKNFVKSNAIENIMAVPRKPQPAYIDTRNGDKHLLENSCLVSKYIKKKDYGQTPEYLQQRREETRREQEEYNNCVKERMKQGAMKQLPEEERQQILQGLKKNWDELYHQFQKLPLVTDTASKKNRKEHLEMKMKQLEKEIEMMERYKIICIANN